MQWTQKCTNTERRDRVICNCDKITNNVRRKLRKTKSNWKTGQLVFDWVQTFESANYTS